MKKVIWFTLILLIIYIIVRIFYNMHKYTYCLENNYELYYNTDTIQGIHKTIAQVPPLYLSVNIRGNIKKFYTSRNYIVGYLSTKYFKEDKLLGLEGDNDKEGYFIINLKTEKIESGLTEKEFDEKVHKIFGIKSNEIQYKDFPSFSLSCLLK